MPGHHDEKHNAKLQGSQDVILTLRIPGYNHEVVEEVNLLDLSNATNAAAIGKRMSKKLRELFK